MMGAPATATTTVRRRWRPDLASLAPLIALLLLLVVGTLVNPNFMSVDNLLNVVTRCAFIALVAIGATFVIGAGGLDLSVGSMTAFVAGVMIMTMNAGSGEPAIGTLALPMLVAVALAAGCGLANGLITTFGRIEPFIVTLGTMGVFRALITYLGDGGTISINTQALRDFYRPVYFGNVLGVPVPVLVFVIVALIASLLMYRTPFGRHVTAIGSSEDVARYSGVSIWRVRTLTYVIQGLCVGIATIIYVPRLGSATPTTGLLWELQAITAVVIGGTALRGGSARIWGTVLGAIILEVIGNIMVLSTHISEYLIGAVQGIIIIVAMLAQRALHRRQT
ncbi:ABC transporter permease [Pararobbsia alpina]|uniref:Ribose import permease protein RbsC n=1 Tax=Pararobbsia alpina TaxID=621374 RepID=A0A6S7B8S0_9BURK|nr:ABC transporter permease [Pararobbsia alpina]CAB3783057.1 Ribose import permease protein RbsC [Pararobbsia alpina]